MSAMSTPLATLAVVVSLKSFFQKVQPDKRHLFFKPINVSPVSSRVGY